MPQLNVTCVLHARHSERPELTALINKRRLCFITILLMMLQAAAIPWNAAQAHDRVALAQAEEVRHGALAPSSDKQGHTHDDGEPDERVPGHLHGHIAFDHSHEAPGLISSFGFISPAAPQQWKPDHGLAARTGPPYQIDRPPKPI